MAMIKHQQFDYYRQISFFHGVGYSEGAGCWTLVYRADSLPATMYFSYSRKRNLNKKQLSYIGCPFEHGEKEMLC